MEETMKYLGALLSVTLVGSASSSVANDLSDSTANPASEPIGSFCFFAGAPPSDMKYRVVKKVKLGKGTYGSVREILPALAERARHAGADAIIGYSGSQRFGFFPWRMVRPVAGGTAVQWADRSKANECAAMGGTTLEDILVANKAP
jgi:hypothetical protein